MEAQKMLVQAQEAAAMQEMLDLEETGTEKLVGVGMGLGK